MYAGAAYIIIELVNNVAEPLHLPDWTATLVILLLIIGFPIVAILSWIFDITPEGLKKTESAKVIKEELVETGKRKLKVSDGIIAILVVVVCILLYPRIFQRDKFKNIRDEDGRISVAVMPFINMTGDTILDIWETGLQFSLINKLSDVDELSVRQPQTMFDIFETTGHTSNASLTPSVESEIALKLESNTYISGNLMKFGNKIRVIATLKYSETNEIYESFEINGNSEDDFFEIIDSLSFLIRNHLEIEVLGQDVIYDEKSWATTKSPEAYRFFLRGLNRFFDSDYPSAIDLFTEAIIEDTTFVNGKLFLAIAYYNAYQYDKSIQIFNVLNKNINNLTYFEQLFTKFWLAVFDKNIQECIRITSLMLDYDQQQRAIWYDLGVCYSILHQYEKAVDAYEKALELDKKWGGNWKWWEFYYELGGTYHKIGQHSKEKEIYELGLSFSPNNPSIVRKQAICALSQGDTKKANEYIVKYRSIGEKEDWGEYWINYYVGRIYYEAEQFNKAIEIFSDLIAEYPQDPRSKWELGFILIDNEINVEEGMELIDQALKIEPENPSFLYTKGLGYYKQGKVEEAYEIINKAWEMRRGYNHEHFKLIQEVEQALANQRSEE